MCSSFRKLFWSLVRESLQYLMWQLGSEQEEALLAQEEKSGKKWWIRFRSNVRCFGEMSEITEWKKEQGENDTHGCLWSPGQGKSSWGVAFPPKANTFFPIGSKTLQLTSMRTLTLKEQKFRLVAHGIRNWTSLSSFSHIKLWFLIPWRQYIASVLSLVLTGTWSRPRYVEPCGILSYTYNQTPKWVFHCPSLRWLSL